MIIRRNYKSELENTQKGNNICTVYCGVEKQMIQWLVRRQSILQRHQDNSNDKEQ